MRCKSLAVHPSLVPDNKLSPMIDSTYSLLDYVGEQGNFSRFGVLGEMMLP